MVLPFTSGTAETAVTLLGRVPVSAAIIASHSALSSIIDLGSEPLGAQAARVRMVIDTNGILKSALRVTFGPADIFMAKRKSQSKAGLAALGWRTSLFNSRISATAVSAAPTRTNAVGAGRPSAISHRITQLGTR